MVPAVTFYIADESDLPAIIALLADDELGAARELPGETIALEYLEAFRVMRSNPDQLIIVGKRDHDIVATLQLIPTVFIANLSHSLMSTRLPSGKPRDTTGRESIPGGVSRLARAGTST